MNKILEKIFTECMYCYPYTWLDAGSSGYLTHYTSYRGIIRHPKKDDYVFRITDEGSPAFQVTYVNENTKRIRVKKTKLQIEYNDVLRDHRKKSGGRGADPEDSKIFLVEKK